VSISLKLRQIYPRGKSVLFNSFVGDYVNPSVSLGVVSPARWTLKISLSIWIHLFWVIFINGKLFSTVYTALHVYIIRRESCIYFSLIRSGFLLRHYSLISAAGKWPYCCPPSSHVTTVGRLYFRLLFHIGGGQRVNWHMLIT